MSSAKLVPNNGRALFPSSLKNVPLIIAMIYLLLKYGEAFTKSLFNKNRELRIRNIGFCKNLMVSKKSAIKA